MKYIGLAMAMDPIEPKLEQTFESERMARMIKECTDLEDLKVIALSLLARLGQQQAASRWLAERGSEAECGRLEMLAKLIRQQRGADSSAAEGK